MLTLRGRYRLRGLTRPKIGSRWDIRPEVLLALHWYDTYKFSRVVSASINPYASIIHLQLFVVWLAFLRFLACFVFYLRASLESFPQVFSILSTATEAFLA